MTSLTKKPKTKYFLFIFFIYCRREDLPHLLRV